MSCFLFLIPMVDPSNKVTDENHHDDDSAENDLPWSYHMAKIHKMLDKWMSWLPRQEVAVFLDSTNQSGPIRKALLPRARKAANAPVR